MPVYGGLTVTHIIDLTSVNQDFKLAGVHIVILPCSNHFYQLVCSYWLTGTQTIIRE